MDDFDEDLGSGALTIRNCIFGFKCNKTWEDLGETSSDNVKFCQSCQKEVFFCESDDELVESIRLNRCVAVFKHGILGDVTATVGYPVGLG